MRMITTKLKLKTVKQDRNDVIKFSHRDASIIFRSVPSDIIKLFKFGVCFNNCVRLSNSSVNFSIVNCFK